MWESLDEQFVSYEFLIESSPVNQCVGMDVARISGNYWLGGKLWKFYGILEILLLLWFS